MKRLLVICLIIISGLGLVGCSSKEEPKDKFVSAADSFTYYSDIEVGNTIYSFGVEKGQKISSANALLGISIQGIYAQDVSIYYYNSDNNYNTWLNGLKQYGKTIEEITIDEMVDNYIAKYQEASYILYDDEDFESLNVATTVAGITKSILIEKDLEDYAISKGLEMSLDATGKTEKWCFETYKDKLNNKSIVQQEGNKNHLRDYAIANQYMCFYIDSSSTSALKLRSEIHNWVVEDAPIFGWGPGNEDSHVGISSMNGQFTIPSDYCYNMSVLAGEYGIDKVTQSVVTEDIVPQEGKHYVSFIRSDGDNVQTWYNYFPFNDKDLAASRGNFDMGWSIQPSLIDLGSTIIKNVYDNATQHDTFVCAVSGHGYIYPRTYPHDALKDFTSRLSMYMRKTDLEVVQLLDSGMDDEVIEMYSQIPELSGGIYMYGDKYSGGNGSVKWSENGKPFIAFRESLWDTTATAVAGRINSYDKDYTKIEGYTMVNLHPWSMGYNDVKELVSLLDDDVVVISPEEFVNMITANVEKKDVSR